MPNGWWGRCRQRHMLTVLRHSHNATGPLLPHTLMHRVATAITGCCVCASGGLPSSPGCCVASTTPDDLVGMPCLLLQRSGDCCTNRGCFLPALLARGDAEVLQAVSRWSVTARGSGVFGSSRSQQLKQAVCACVLASEMHRTCAAKQCRCRCV